jgi:hypothetical protein
VPHAVEPRYASASTTQCGQIRAAAKNHASATSLDQVESNVSPDTQLARPMLYALMERGSRSKENGHD